MQIQTLIAKNEHKLPLLYQNRPENELLNDKEDSALEEFIICCLLDPNFPGFVNKVECVLKNILKDDPT